MNENMIERGDIYFFYRPRVGPEYSGEPIIKSPRDIQRLYVVLHPSNVSLYRLLLVGHKKLPEIKLHPDKNWVLIEKVTKKREHLVKELEEKTYDTKTRGRRILPAVRPIGEGVYGIVTYQQNTYLVYILELPKQLGEVQKSLYLKSQARYAISVKNPTKPGIKKTDVKFPQHLMKKFDDRRFIPLNPSKFLDYEGAELLFIGASTYIDKGTHKKLAKQEETLHSADIFNELKLWREKHPILPLVTGEWI